jgi:hypothetical protein
MASPFPIRWLSYRARIREDAKRLYELPDGKNFFSEDYLAAISAEARRLESWEVKLIVAQATIAVFFVVGFLSRDPSLSLFGVSLKDAIGIKEVVLAISSTLSIMSMVVTSSKNTLLHVLDVIVEMSTPKEYVGFAKLATPTSFSVKAYFARQYERWVFSTFFPKFFFVSVALLGMILVVFIIAFSMGLYIIIFLDIYQHPTLGRWSTAILAYTGVTWIFGAFWLVRFYAPLPYRDMGPARKLR